MENDEKTSTDIILMRFLSMAPNRRVSLVKPWITGDVISTQSWYHPTEAEQLSIIPHLYHPTVNQSQMLAHKAASVNTLVALYCNFAKKTSNDFHSLKSSYPGNVWYSASAESNRSLSFDTSLQATLRSQAYVIQKKLKIFAGVNE